MISPGKKESLPKQPNPPYLVSFMETTWTAKDAVRFLKERMYFEGSGREIGPFTREEMTWWLESAESGKWVDGSKIEFSPEQNLCEVPGCKGVKELYAIDEEHDTQSNYCSYHGEDPKGQWEAKETFRH